VNPSTSPTVRTAPHEGRQLLLVARSVWIETLRRKDLYVLFIFMGFYVLGVGIVAIVGIENPATATFMLNLGMSFAWIAAHMLTLLTTSRQIPFDLENRTLYPLLAKPLSRRNYLLGKWFAAASSGALVYLALWSIAWVVTPKMEPFSSGLLGQSLVLAAVSLAMMAALALCLSLLTPHAVTLVACALLFVAGSQTLNFFKTRMAETPWRPITHWVTDYVPNFGKLNLITRYTDGIGPLGIMEFSGLVFYALIFSVVLLAVSQFAFERRSL